MEKSSSINTAFRILQKEIKSLTKHMLRQFGANRYIANLGHGIYPDVDPAKVEIFVNAVHDYSTKMLQNDLSPE